jgi:membrane-associated phospholipid phosphatase
MDVMTGRDRQRGGRALRGWWLDGVLLAAFAALTAALAAGWFLGLDLAVRDWCDTHRPQVGYWIARVVNYLGSGTSLTVIALALAALIAWRQRSIRPLVLPAVAFVLTTGVILPLKDWTNRAAPRSELPDAVEIFNQLPVGEYGESYPSGHVVVAIVWYGVLVSLLAALVPIPPRLRTVIRLAPPLIVVLTTTYLSFHWLTDGLAAICLGLVLDRLIVRMRQRWLHLGTVDRDLATTGDEPAGGQVRGR